MWQRWPKTIPVKCGFQLVNLCRIQCRFQWKSRMLIFLFCMHTPVKNFFRKLTNQVISLSVLNRQLPKICISLNQISWNISKWFSRTAKFQIIKFKNTEDLRRNQQIPNLPKVQRLATFKCEFCHIPVTVCCNDNTQRSKLYIIYIIKHKTAVNGCSPSTQFNT